VAKLNFLRTHLALFDEYSEKEMMEINDLSDSEDDGYSDDDGITVNNK
jgi:hypothetical protein